MSRRPILAANWKMNNSRNESQALVKALRESAGPPSDREVLICPPFTALEVVGEALKGCPWFLGAQNMNDNKAGAYTGEISVSMLKDLGCSHVILGHSERRQYYSETNNLVNKKCLLALDEKLVPVVCVGETLSEREAGKTLQVVESQITGSLKGIHGEQASSVVVAYEPIWAIGTGKTATTEQAQEVHAQVRAQLEKLFGEGVANAIRILYGGSVKADNIDVLMAQPDIDGGLVGGASLKSGDFSRIINFQVQSSASV